MYRGTSAVFSVNYSNELNVKTENLTMSRLATWKSWLGIHTRISRTWDVSDSSGWRLKMYLFDQRRFSIEKKKKNVRVRWILLLKFKCLYFSSFRFKNYIFDIIAFLNTMLFRVRGAVLNKPQRWRDQTISLRRRHHHTPRIPPEPPSL